MVKWLECLLVVLAYSGSNPSTSAESKIQHINYHSYVEVGALTKQRQGTFLKK